MADRSYSQEEIQELMDAIDPRELSYGDWFRATAGFKYMDATKAQIEAWCSSDPRFKTNDIIRRWDGITDTGGVTAGTIYYLAREQGYTGSAPGYQRGRENATEEPQRTIEALPDVPGSFADFQADILSEMSQAEQRRAFLETMYQGKDYLNFVFEAEYDSKKGKWFPHPQQKEAYTRDEWIQHMNILEREDYIHEAGLWMRLNPTVEEPQGALKKNGERGIAVCDEDIADFRYALIECDDIPEEKQIQAFRRLNLPIQALVLSGGKSVHAAVRIDAKDVEEYKQRVSVLHSWCKKYGIPIDTANKNPSRMIRVPGVTRGDREQKLIGLQQGPRSWEDFQFFMEGVDLGLPDLDAIEDINGENLPQRMPEIIHGALREKEIMEISGASKTSKTFLLIEQGLAVSAGRLWLNMPCKPGNVLYVNMEVNKADFANRLETVREAMDISLDEVKGRLQVWNMRGHNVTMEDLVKGIHHLKKRYRFKLIILDPIYKLLGDLDENSAGDVGQLFSFFDTIAEMTGAAVVFAHHHSKGGQSGKVSSERSSGSGTFSRAPDVILDMLQLEIPPETEEVLEFEGNPIGIRYEWTLRGYAPREPETGFFEYPIHVPDPEGILKGARSAKEALASDAKKNNANRTINWAEVIVTTFVELLEASYNEGNPYPGQVRKDDLVLQVHTKTKTTEDTSLRQIRSRCDIERAKKGRPSFVTLKEAIGTAVGIKPPAPQESAEEAEEGAEEDIQQLSL